MEIVRYVDVATAASVGGHRPGTFEEHIALLLTLYGFCPALSSLLPLTAGSRGLGLAPSSDQYKAWAGTLLQQIGKIRLLRRVCSLARSGALSVEQRGSAIHFNRTTNELGAEAQELLERRRLDE